MFVRDWMSTPAVAMSSSASVLDALRVMEMRSVRRLPVLDGDELRGIVTREDLHALLGYGEGMAREAEAPIERVMRSPVLTVSPQDTLERAAEIMLEREVFGPAGPRRRPPDGHDHGIRRLPGLHPAFGAE